MSDQPSGNNPNNNRPPNNNNNRRPQNNNNQRRRALGPNPNNQNAAGAPGAAAGNPKPNPGPGQGNPNNNRRRHGRNHNNRPRTPNGNPNGNPNQGQNPNQNSNQPHGLNIERIYEKYLNLLDQHLIARRKYHDLFYRADPAQKNKLERNFYNTLNDIRDFESKLAPEARALFEKRNNGLSPDNIYTSNHELPTVGEAPPPETEWADPHYLQSQKQANFAEDKEESVGSADDYLKYKNLL